VRSIDYRRPEMLETFRQIILHGMIMSMSKLEPMEINNCGSKIATNNHVN
jgi:hypothetical protein